MGEVVLFLLKCEQNKSGDGSHGLIDDSSRLYLAEGFLKL